MVISKRDMIKFCLDNKDCLDLRKIDFLKSINKLKVMFLSTAQEQYLVACYDQVVSKLYNLEPMATDREFAAKRAIKKARAKK